MQNANKSPSHALSVASSGSSSAKNRAIETTDDLRKFLSHIAVAVAQGEMKINEAAVAVKACEQINASLYSEIKSAALQAEAGKAAPQLGSLRISGEDVA